MSTTLNARIAHEVFDAHVRLVYSIAWKWCRRITARLGKSVPPGELEELVQDAVARAFAGFLRRCEKGLPKVSDRKAWVGQCAMSGVKNACKAARRFANAAPYPRYVDAMDRRGSLENRSFRHGTDDERDGVLEQLHYQPVFYAPQRWEVEALLEREHVPEHLRMTALYAAMGIGQEDSGKLQGCTDRTIRNRMADLREYLNPPCTHNVYTVVIDALREVCR